MDDAQDLIDRLCTAAGMIMEDTVEQAIAPGTMAGTAERVGVVAEAGGHIAALATAAAVIAARWLPVRR